MGARPETQAHAAASPNKVVELPERSMTCSRNCLPERSRFSLMYISVQPSQNRNRGVNSLYSELQWLLPAPKDFSDRLKALNNSPGPLGSELQALAQHGLNLNQLTKLAKAMARAKTDGKSLDPLVPFRLAVLSNSNDRSHGARAGGECCAAGHSS